MLAKLSFLFGLPTLVMAPLTWVALVSRPQPAPVMEANVAQPVPAVPGEPAHAAVETPIDVQTTATPVAAPPVAAAPVNVQAVVVPAQLPDSDSHRAIPEERPLREQPD